MHNKFKLFPHENYRSILCLNGTLPPADFFAIKLPVFAADGAANRLTEMGIVPEMVIGDLDSITQENLAALNSHYHFDQDYCDFEKSLQYLQQKNLLPAIILGLEGGYLDHTLNNINCFMQTAGSVFYSPPLSGFVLREKEHRTLALPLQTKISLIGLPYAKLSSQGLKWELNQYELFYPGKNSCFNRSVSKIVKLDAHAGNTLILIYTEKT